MKSENLFIMSPIIFLVGVMIAALVELETKPRPIPTEAEIVMMERMAKIAATAQGECK
jgi:hypothetical protein